MSDLVSLGYNSNYVNAQITDGEHITGNMDFYTVYTLNALTETLYGAADAGQNLLRVGEILGLGAQPVLLSVTTVTGVDLTVSGNRTTYGLGTSIDGTTNSSLTSATVYVLKFSTEHAGAFVNSGTNGFQSNSTTTGTVAYQLVNETNLAALPFSTTAGTATLTKFVTINDSATLANTSVKYSNVL